MFCRKCLGEIAKRLHGDDRKVLTALYENRALNKETASHVTKLTTSKLRDALSRLKGAMLIEETKVGNSILLRLSDSGNELLKTIDEINSKGG